MGLEFLAGMLALPVTYCLGYTASWVMIELNNLITKQQ